jgi:CubicO group peptidase (beta-lactamase class C family)
MAAAPGTVTNYSNGDSHLLSAIIAKVTGSPALDFACNRLFGPLGIDDVRWDADPQGRSIGSAALYLRPVDMTKLGLLYLASGAWNGQRILSADWGGAGQRIGMFPELGVVVVMTASIGDDFPRSPFAGTIYDDVLQATK